MRPIWKSWHSRAGAMLALGLLLFGGCDHPPTFSTMPAPPPVPGPIAGAWAIRGTLQGMDTVTISTTVNVTQWVGVDSVFAMVDDVVLSGPHSVIAIYSPLQRSAFHASWGGTVPWEDWLEVGQLYRSQDAALDNALVLGGHGRDGVWSGGFALHAYGIGTFTARR
jgi:hypothetical protein